MSILTKPYKISVYDDRYEGGQLREHFLGVIGSNDMDSPNRVLEPTLTRNVNGVKKMTFKMYKRYVDTITGEEVENPFSNWLVSERKVKLQYDGKWYDFIIKDINENSSNYLYTYSLEDAIVQELSKNGFGVTLDAELMNNIGNAKELGTNVLADTGWSVDSEVFVQTVDEALVYITIPAGTVAQHIIDQTNSNLNQGITTESYTFSEAKTILAFYSSCKNKPHRFQFIYSSNGYNLDGGKYKISRKDDRTIDESNCQYYIDYDTPETVYKEATSTNAKGLGLFLPDGFGDGNVGKDTSGKSSNDSPLSSWYRGKRYGFAQQSVYVPILERYCQKFRREEKIPLIKDKNIFHHGSDGEVSVTTADGASSALNLTGGISTAFSPDNTTSEVQSIEMKKKHKWVGLRLELDHHDYDEYVLKYDLTVKEGTLKTIGGHNAHYEPISYKVLDSDGTDLAEKLVQTGSYVTLGGNPITSGTYNVEIRYKKRASTNGQKHLFLQPNRDTETYIYCKISNLSITMEGDYLGYTESEFVSPTLVQNCVTNAKFESTSGWTATASSGQVSKEKAKVENFYGRFDKSDNKFVTISEDFYNGDYDEEEDYHAGLKMSFFNQNQFVLNSGIRDNRSIIVEMPKDEKWVLDYKIVDSSNTHANSAFNISLGEYLYNTDNGGYSEKTGYISFTCADATGTDCDNIPADYARKIITISDSKYTKETFKKDSRIYLKFQPTSVTTTTVDGEVVPQVWYLEGASLYRRTVGDDGKIIIPDYEETNSLAATEYVKQGTIAHKYHYFNQAYITGSNAVTDKEKLATMVRETLDYTVYKPVYNTGAEKVRSVTAKESNYFNILQSIAETFEAWLDLEITRDDDTGVVTAKKVKFKNYIGKNNYANFRYGVNLKDIQRTYSSKNIVTKLMVKQNNNELAENGFCTIQRAGANPTGENYIYDFQYYQNTGIMDARDYLDTVYYLDGAIGPDATLWNDASKVKANEVENKSDTTLNGYYQRIKKINDALLPINEEIIGHSTDLVKKKAELEVAEATKAAATEGIEQTAENFLALTGIYPEEAQTGQITSIALDIKDGNHGITKSEEWWYVDTDPTPVEEGLGYEIEVKVASYNETCHAKIVEDQGTTMTQLTGDGVQIEKSYEYTGIYLEEQWEDKREYTLTYDLEVLEGTLLSFGGHAECFKDYKYVVESNQPETNTHKQEFTDSVANRDSDFGDVTKYKITFTGTYIKPSGIPSYSGRYDLWIQPNRAKTATEAGTIKCEISNIKLTKMITQEEATKSYDRNAHFYLGVKVGIGTDPDDAEKPRTTITRTYSVTCKVPANATSATIEQGVSSIDTDSSNVKKYIEEYTLYYEKLESSTNDVNRITPQITALEQAIKEKEERRNTLLEYKKQLNKLFFKKYSRFILEGTWINEEYIDDDKYFADAQSVLYNSCYPQVAYNISVISLKGLPGYELIDFDLGDKTNVIDEQFFGNKLQEEVIITEMSERLDDPSKNTIKVQNFKNQFQDLFQKITATVQQTQYNVGSYEKGAALVDANYKKQNEWITKAINNAESYLQYGQTVTTDNSGITIVDSSNKQNKLRLVGGAILFSVEKPDQDDTTWMTGITNSGISANLITAGRLDTGAVQIMSGDKPVFRWDAYGISAYDAYWSTAGGINTISGVNTNKFVRFDKNGIYGINNVPGINSTTWYPSDNSSNGKTALQQIDENATFALTWDGLKVTGNEGVIARMGKLDGSIFKITNEDQIIIDVQNNGISKIGNLTVGNRISENLITDDVIGLFPKNTEGVTLTKNEDGSYTVTSVAANQPNAGLSIGTEKPLFEKNQNYIIKYKFKILDKPEDDEITLIAGHQSEFTILAATVDGVQQSIASVNAYNDGFVLDPDVEGGIHTVEMLVCYTNPTLNAPYPGLYIQPQRQPADTDENVDYSITFQVSDIEVNWKTLTESADSPNFSWKFCPMDGMFMWNGHQGSGKIAGETLADGESIDSNLVFRVNEDNLYMRGTIVAEAGDIAGWTIKNIQDGEKRESSITKGTPGTTQSFGLYTFYPNDKGVSVSDSGSKINWRILVDNKFGVDANGYVYAAAGKIGDMEIGDLVRNAIGENLLLKSNIETTSSAYKTATYVPVAPLVAGEKYTLTICVTPGTGVKDIRPYFSSGYSNPDSVKFEFQSDVSAASRGREIISRTFTMAYNGDRTPEHNSSHAQLELYRFDDKGVGNDTSTTTFGDTTVHWVKIEKGTSATAWCLASEEIVQTSVNTNKFSWKFSPSDGMFMWNGAQGTGAPSSDTNLVFKVGPKESGNGNELFMRGHVEAESGKIGSWNITDGLLMSSVYSASIDDTTYYYRSFMSSPPDTYSPSEVTCFEIQRNTKSDFTGTMEYPFYIRPNGEMHATRGTIAGFTFTDISDASQKIYPGFYNKYIGFYYEYIEFKKIGARLLQGGEGTFPNGKACLVIEGRTKFNGSVAFSDGNDIYINNTALPWDKTYEGSKAILVGGKVTVKVHTNLGFVTGITVE